MNPHRDFYFLIPIRIHYRAYPFRIHRGPAFLAPHAESALPPVCHIALIHIRSNLSLGKNPLPGIFKKGGADRNPTSPRLKGDRAQVFREYTGPQNIPQ